MRHGARHLSAVLLLAAAALVDAGDAPQDAIKKEIQKLQGKWLVISAELSGKPVDDPKGKSIVIAGKKMKFQEKDDVKDASYTLDPGKTPKHIDIIPGDKGIKGVLRGIYEVNGDKLKLCLGAGKTEAKKGEKTKTLDSKRPTAFDAKKAILIILERSK